MIAAEKIELIKKSIHDNNITYVEVLDVKNDFTFPTMTKDVVKLVSDIDEYLSNNDFDGKVIVKLYPNKSKKTIFIPYIFHPTSLSAPVANIGNAKGDIDLQVKHALLIQSIEFNEKLREKDKAIAEMQYDEEEETVKTPMQLFLDKTLSGIMQNPNFQVDPINTAIGYISQIAGMFNAKHVINSHQLAGVDNTINEVRSLIGEITFDFLMKQLLVSLKEDKQGTMEKIQKIFQ
jgi:hypothetical protein